VTRDVDGRSVLGADDVLDARPDLAPTLGVAAFRVALKTGETTEAATLNPNGYVVALQSGTRLYAADEWEVADAE
jgi:hypothetical protein